MTRNQVDYDTLNTLKSDFDSAFSEMCSKITQKANDIAELNESKGWSGASGDYFRYVYEGVSASFKNIQNRFDQNLQTILDTWASEFQQAEAQAQSETNTFDNPQ